MPAPTTISNSRTTTIPCVPKCCRRHCFNFQVLSWWPLQICVWTGSSKRAKNDYYKVIIMFNCCLVGVDSNLRESAAKVSHLQRSWICHSHLLTWTCASPSSSQFSGKRSPMCWTPCQYWKRASTISKSPLWSASGLSTTKDSLCLWTFRLVQINQSLPVHTWKHNASSISSIIILCATDLKDSCGWCKEVEYI